MNRNLLVLLFLLFSIVVGYVLLSLFPLDEGPPVVEQIPPECEANKTKECILGSCPGTMMCQDGKWGRCRLEMICEPGDHYPCSECGCSKGYRICNACGTGYGICITPDS